MHFVDRVILRLVDDLKVQGRGKESSSSVVSCFFSFSDPLLPHFSTLMYEKGREGSELDS